MSRYAKATKRKQRGGARQNGRSIKVGPVESADFMLVKLRYPIRGTLAAVAAVVSKRWTINAAYDVDPVVGSTSTPGFAEYAALYTYYRVEKAKVNCTFSNLDNLSVSLYSVVSNTDPGTAGTNYYDYAQSAFGKTFELAPFYSGRGTVTLRQTINLNQVEGMNLQQADSFRSVTTSIPSDLIYWGFGIYSNAGTNFANGVGYSGFIEMFVRFYGRQDQLLSLNRPSGAEWEANRRVFKLKRARELELKPPPDTEKVREDFEKQVETLVLAKLTNACLEQNPAKRG